VKLDLSSLEYAIQALGKALQSHASLSQNDSVTADDMDTVQAGVIQNFEVAYEQCWKMMKRWLESNLSPEMVDGVTRRELFRVAAESRLIDDVDGWMDYHDARNLTSHTYSEENAKIVFAAARIFLPAAQDFLSRIAARND
jgi:nucleotidyltransferase substrate binding protein (TIGR01987 family)